jgi:GTPase SAR1 family protein
MKTPPSTAQLASLQSSDELSLLDGIDKLRSQGISHYVQLPQLIVCGDQSSGKSSVLEAISGIPFPTKDNLCTRFPTEVILRRTPTVSGVVSIVPSQDRSEADSDRLSRYHATLTTFSELGSVMETANQLMGITAGTSGAYSDDVLRLEITGPDQPHLTIVDLPGLIHSQNKAQTEDDVNKIRRMIRTYMENQRSIILAIVSAKNDLANQAVLNMAKNLDPKGLRTIGIITKPDELPQGSDSEMEFVKLARNENVEFRLGWHVVRNRKYEERDTTLEARDAVEKEFFDAGVWSDFPRNAVGIHTLRPRLSKVLLDQIKSELPNVMVEIDSKLKVCRSKLDRLGPSRSTFEDQRNFLLKISQNFQALARAAIDGVYNDPFFGDAQSDMGYSKRVRAVIQNLNLDFARRLREKGHRWTVTGNVEGSVLHQDHGSEDENEEEAESTEESPEQQAPGVPVVTSRPWMILYIKKLLKRSRGPELPGLFSPMIIADLFRTQSAWWEKLAQEHVSDVWDQCLVFLGLLMTSLTDETTAERVHKKVISPHMEGKFEMLNQKLAEILQTYSRSHPITYNHYFTETVQKIRDTRLEQDVRNDLLAYFGQKGATEDSFYVNRSIHISAITAIMTKRKEADMDSYACSEIFDCMQAYYKVFLLHTKPTPSAA